MFKIIFVLFFSTAYAATYSCKTTYGDLDIPHVEASSMEEFYYCFGLNHGQDRAWEMDYFRRVGQGRNAEVLGFSQLKSDLMMRLLDLPPLAQKLWTGFPADKKKLLELYSEGVNEGFKTGKTAREFTDAGYEPEQWKPEDSVLILLLQSFDQTRKTFWMDYQEELTKENWGDKAADLFNEDHIPWQNTILKEGEYEKASSEVKTTSTYKPAPKLWEMFPSVFGEESGSNNWVVSKFKSTTGNAILANDPHLDLKTPMFWYWMKIKTPELTVMGASVPGVPVIASGTNGKVAWGLTNSYLNTADAVYIKDLKSDDVESFRPTVWIKVWFFKIPFFFKSFEKLVSGHRILPLETKSDQKLVLRWTGFDLSSNDLLPMFDMNKVQNVDEMEDVTARIGLPSWNYVFADINGDVGFRTIGKTYKNVGKIPYGVVLESYEQFKSQELLSPEHQPHVLKPARQYVYTANNRHWPEDAKYYGGRGYSHSHRGFRIDELLQGKHDIQSFQQIQCDRQVVDARFYLPRLLKAIPLPELENWNFLATDSSTELPFYRRLVDTLLEKWKVNEYALFRLLDQLDDEKKESLKQIVSDVRNQTKGKTWGSFHRLLFPHMTNNSEWSFSPDIAGVGDNHSVDPGTSKWNEDKKIYEQTAGASMRMIIELDKAGPRILLNLPGVNRKYVEGRNSESFNNWKNCQYTSLQF